MSENLQLEQVSQSQLDSPDAAEHLAIRSQLDAREGDGLSVQLLHEAATNEVSVKVEDSKSGENFHFRVLGHQALQAFQHPYVFAPGEGLIQ